MHSEQVGKVGPVQFYSCFLCCSRPAFSQNTVPSSSPLCFPAGGADPVLIHCSRSDVLPDEVSLCLDVSLPASILEFFSNESNESKF